VGVVIAATETAPPRPYSHLKAVVSEEAGRGASSFATPARLTTLMVHVVLIPKSEDLEDAAVIVTPPPSVELVGRCSYVAAGTRHRCIDPPGEARAEVDHLSSDEPLRLTLEAKVVEAIRGEEPVVVRMSSADTERTEEKRIELYAPTGGAGERSAERIIRHEELEGPAAWKEATLRSRAVALDEIGDEWSLLTPRHLHSVDSIPYGRLVELRNLLESRLIGSKIITIHSVIASPPVRVHDYTLEDGQRAWREAFALGSRKAHRVWCSTVRGSRQSRLYRGETVVVRAAVVGWGLARPGGRLLQAVLLLCPAVQSVDGHRSRRETSRGGGTTAPVLTQR